MSIYRNSCRQTERVTMKKMFAQGFNLEQISVKLRVAPHIIGEVVEGKWDSKEKAMALQAMENNRVALLGKADEESSRIAQIAAAAAAAINGHSPVVDKDALRKEIEAELRAEMAAELSPQQRGANTRKANKEASDGDQEAA
jgi:hypothetical protein